MTMTIITAATLAYDERKFKYLASFLYFCERDDRLLAFVSSAGIEKIQGIGHKKTYIIISSTFWSVKKYTKVF